LKGLARVEDSHQGECVRSLPLYYWTVVAFVLLAAATLRHWDLTLAQRTRAIAFDTYQQLLPRKYDPATPVRIVDIDDASLAARGQWPWPRSDLAALVSRLEAMGAVAIVFDMVFPEPDRLSPEQIAKRFPADKTLAEAQKLLSAAPTNDQTFSDAIAQGGVVLAFAGVHSTAPLQRPPLIAELEHRGDDPRLFVPAFPNAVVNLPLLSAKAAGSGFNNWTPEQDQIIRKLPLLIRIGDTVYPSIAAEGLRVAQGISNYLIVASGSAEEQAFGTRTGITKVMIGDAAVPTDGSGQMWLRFTHSDRRRYISAQSVLDSTVSSDMVKGAIILIGTSAAGLLDVRATPLEAAIPGVEAHAQAIEQMLVGDYLSRPDFATGGEIVFTLAAGLLLALAVYYTGAAVGAVIGAFAVACVLVASFMAFSRAGWLLDPSYPIVTLTAVYLAGSSFLRLATERERNRNRDKLAKIAREMESASQIQRSFLPRDELDGPLRGRFNLFATMKPAKDVGGDFYDYFMISDNKLGFAIGDVSGKGVPAALFMSVSRTVLRTIAFEAGEPGDVLARANVILARDNSEGMFVTLFYAILDLDTGALQLSSAGHDDLFLLTGGDEIESLQHMGPAVGLFEEAQYATLTRQLKSGDAVFVLTDGVTEAFNIDGRVFTVDRLATHLRRCSRSDAKTIVESVTREVTAFSQGTEQSDDITCVAVQFTG
jgi:serine phosphatase RsbU (regulator of sigma subunit)/CHASE2 domain-containing sensor protein